MKNQDTEELHTFPKVHASWSGNGTEIEAQQSDSRAHGLPSFCALVRQLCYVKAFRAAFALILYSTQGFIVFR